VLNPAWALGFLGNWRAGVKILTMCILVTTCARISRPIAPAFEAP